VDRPNQHQRSHSQPNVNLPNQNNQDTQTTPNRSRLFRLFQYTQPPRISVDELNQTLSDVQRSQRSPISPTESLSRTRTSLPPSEESEDNNITRLPLLRNIPEAFQRNEQFNFDDQIIINERSNPDQNEQEFEYNNELYDYQQEALDQYTRYIEPENNYNNPELENNNQENREPEVGDLLGLSDASTDSSVEDNSSDEEMSVIV